MRAPSRPLRLSMVLLAGSVLSPPSAKASANPANEVWELVLETGISVPGLCIDDPSIESVCPRTNDAREEGDEVCPALETADIVPGSEPCPELPIGP